MELSWTGANPVDVYIYRNQSVIPSVQGGSYNDNIGVKGGGGAIYLYKVCAAGDTDTCSSDVSVTF